MANGIKIKYYQPAGKSFCVAIVDSIVYWKNSEFRKGILNIRAMNDKGVVFECQVENLSIDGVDIDEQGFNR